jgi:hypothetical protein
MIKSMYLRTCWLCMAVLIRAGAVAAQTATPLKPHSVHNPEPATLLSFVVAVVIGAGVFLLGRRRKERK